MKILLLNFHSPQNAGDLAILQESLKYLHQAYPDADITVTTNDPQATDGLPPASYCPSMTRWLMWPGDREWRWRRSMLMPYGCWLLLSALLYRFVGRQLPPLKREHRQLMAEYSDAQLVVVIGGGHLYARHMLNIAFLWLWLGIALAVVMRKPLVLLPQSFGPLPGPFQQRLLRWLVARARFVAAREHRSATFLHTIGLHTPVLVLPDLAFTADEAPPGAADALLAALALDRAPDRPLIGLTLMDWAGQNPSFACQQQYETAITALVHRLHDRYHAYVVIFAQCTGPTLDQDDRRIARRIVAELGDSVEIVLIDAALPPPVLKAAYRRLDAMIATRMHAAILALSTGTPTVVIGYLHKSQGMMDMLGLENYALSIDAIAPAILCSTFDQLWEQRGLIRNHLERRIPALQEQLYQLPQLLRASVAEL